MNTADVNYGPPSEYPAAAEARLETLLLLPMTSGGETSIDPPNTT
jgi:hypothetical protein